ncbi:hypothetical protein RSOL_394830 [Rhizoctonia solani AG-3 Rhs1AP]|uniref:Uncharacterized protein n=2 Tax=Rhizoctonia solani AG-3 TaxID=1086053 RepID=A0A074S4J3_9AGAM|nr:hypothetical protein RSOL_394830 [Rhizoctonia solani AG-3 Rhs1AP]KEP52510.1 hypothetical protein V565_044510 [Rhizoctonia solani 123E]
MSNASDIATAPIPREFEGKDFKIAHSKTGTKIRITYNKGIVRVLLITKKPQNVSKSKLMEMMGCGNGDEYEEPKGTRLGLKLTTKNCQALRSHWTRSHKLMLGILMGPLMTTTNSTWTTNIL